VRETTDGFVGVVHCHCHSSTLEIVDVHSSGLSSVLGSVY
jgi:hypothetical protein